MNRFLCACIVCVTLGACTTTLPRETVYQFYCDDGTAFTAEITGIVLNIHGPTGTVVLSRVRDTDQTRYTNSLRTVVLEEDGVRARYRIGRREWTECTRREI